ncbi:MAG: AMP-binding protein [Gammaproteobacteria bacterium]|nr:AMP-binding protein [Gammaproteobacteria bacterium]
MRRAPGGVPSSHRDGYARAMLPAAQELPDFDFSADNLAAYPDHLNAAVVLLEGIDADGSAARPAYHFGHTTWSFQQLAERVDRIARVLVEDFGLVPGNRVLLRSGNNPMFVACWLAVLKAGGICVATMPLLTADELTFICNRVAVRFALAGAELAENLEAAKDRAPSLERIAYFTPCGDGQALASIVPDLDRLSAAKAGGFAAVATAADDIALIAFTSGTTGRPKAVAHYHRDLLAIADCYPRVVPVRQGDVVSGMSSMAFLFGLAVLLIYPLRFRASVVLPARTDPDFLLDAITRRRVTSLYGVPTVYHHLLDRIDRYDLGSLRQCASSGEHLPASIWEHWHERTGLHIANGYGATEILSTFVSTSPNNGQPGVTGLPVPGYTVRLIDEDGVPVAADTPGRLAVRGPTGCRYLDDSGQQRKYVHDGWNVTSDLFVQDGEGRLRFIDRVDDIIVSSGYKISPQEVEQVLLEHAKVRECAVIGVDDATRGKRVCACVVLHDAAIATAATARELQDFVKLRITPYKYPREIRFLEVLPRTATGKLQRARLR